MGRPLTYPVGTTMYDPSQCWNGYNLFSLPQLGTILMDMNGKPVRFWKELDGFPARLLPGGRVMGSRGRRSRAASYQDQLDLVICGWDGQVEWCFDRKEFCADEGMASRYMARQHHDYHRYGEPVYYVPGTTSSAEPEKTLILCHRDVRRKKISCQLLEDDVLIEVNRQGDILWEWHAVDHFSEFGFDETARNVIYRNPNIQPCGPEGQGDLFHINCASYLGPNRWYDAGDQRFHPDNIIMDSREASIMFIIDHNTGKVVWQVGPDYTASRELRLLGPVIGMHATHMIPKGLPGAGNILVFDNGGWSGYGAPSQTSRMGLKSMHRDSSRVIEFDPVTLKLVWQFDASSLGFPQLFAGHYFYSPLISNAQRLPNGNTLINEGCDGNLLEVTPQGAVVWNYVNPYIDPARGGNCYRCYRVPYEWVPQLPPPQEVAMARVEVKSFRLPGCADPTLTPDIQVTVPGTLPLTASTATFCVEKL